MKRKIDNTLWKFEGDNNIRSLSLLLRGGFIVYACSFLGNDKEMTIWESKEWEFQS